MEATALLPLGMGLIVLGAGLGIGRLASAAAEGIARQPEAADKSYTVTVMYNGVLYKGNHLCDIICGNRNTTQNATSVRVHNASD